MINTDLVKEGVAVRCNTVEEYLQLVEAMGWKICPNPYPVGIFCIVDKYNNDGYRFTKTEPNGLNIYNFSDLKQSNLANVLGVKEGQRFEYTYSNGKTGIYWIGADGRRWHIYNGQEYHSHAENHLVDIINNPDKIKILEPYSQETIEDAKAAIQLGFKNVYREKDGTIKLQDDSGYFYIDCHKFPEIKLREMILLKDIVAHEQ